MEVLMKLYAAFDLHSSNNYLAVIDEEGKRQMQKKLPNDAGTIVTALSPYRKRSRELPRKRGHLVRLRISLIISLQHIITRNCGIKCYKNSFFLYFLI